MTNTPVFLWQNTCCYPAFSQGGGNDFPLIEKAAKLLGADLMFLAAGKMFLSIKPSYFNTYY